LAQRGSRKRRKSKRRAAAVRSDDVAEEEPAERPSDTADAMARAYARGRERDEAARAELEPLAEGERPVAVTVGALVAGGLAIANLISFAVGYDPGDSGKVVPSLLVVFLLGFMAWGMWRVRYWAVLGMQTLLGITILAASVGAMFAGNLNALVLVFAIIAPAGTLFWFLVKSMARIQMPERPGAQ
jgi:hypothetical protein